MRARYIHHSPDRGTYRKDNIVTGSIAALRTSSIGDYYVMATGVGRMTGLTTDGLDKVGGYYDAEAPGRWMGKGCAALGLGVGDEVDAEVFKSLLRGLDPATVKPLR